MTSSFSSIKRMNNTYFIDNPRLLKIHAADCLWPNPSINCQVLPPKLPPCHAYKTIVNTNPLIQYQNQKVIQGTCRSSSAVYTMNLAGVSVFQFPNPVSRVNWNQSSDRREPHGSGVDIKYNSYARYMNRIKGKKPYRTEVLGRSIVPTEGNKTTKTAFFDRCKECVAIL
jgi:hypothetical protein